MIGRRLLMGGGGSFTVPPGPTSYQLVAAPNAGAWTEVAGAHAAYANARTYVIWIGGTGKINDEEIIARADGANPNTYVGPILLKDNITDGSATTSPDSHLGGAVLPTAANIVTAYCGHGDTHMRVKLSNNVSDITAGFTAEIALSGPGTGTIKTYAQLARLTGSTPANRIYVSYRGTGGGEAGLYQQSSDDNGATWGASTQIFHTTQITLYSAFVSNGSNRIFYAVTDRAPDAVGGYGMWAFYMDQAGTFRDMAGVALAGSAPFSTAQLTQIVAAGGDQYPYSVSIASGGEMVIAWQTKNANPVRFGEFRQSAVGSATFTETQIGTSEPLTAGVNSIGGGAHAWNDCNRFIHGKVVSSVIYVYLYTRTAGVWDSGVVVDTVTCAPSPVYVASPGSELTWVWFGEGFVGSSSFAPSLRGIA